MAILTFVVVAGSALFFSAKGIIAKLAYAGGADAITVLVLRTSMSLPVFAAVLWWTNRRAQHRLTARDWRSLALLGFFGWYLASWLDFKGLEHISAGLERIVLFSYPVMVVLATAIRRRITDTHTVRSTPPTSAAPSRSASCSTCCSSPSRRSTAGRSTRSRCSPTPATT